MTNLHGMLFYSLKEVSHDGLIQLTNWLPNIAEEREYLQKEHTRISKDPSRCVRLVSHKNEIALFVNPLAWCE